MSIEPLSPAVRDYFRAFDVTAIALMRDGGITAKRDPAGAATAWWCETVKARAVPRLARKGGGDIPAAARALGVALTDHATVLGGAKAVVANIKAGMAWARRTGVLHEFNQEYRRRRLEAQGRHERFMGLRAGDGADSARFRRDRSRQFDGAAHVAGVRGCNPVKTQHNRNECRTSWRL
jgi:hypothetical protein